MIQAMRIGINGSSLVAMGSDTAALVDHARTAEADGFATWWAAQLAVPDALGVLGAVGAATSRIELGTAVIAIWGRHPLVLASQALTTSEMSGGRLVLGIGLAHRSLVEKRLHISFDHPAAQMDEYLSVLLPSLQDRSVGFVGKYFSAEVENLGGPAGIETPSVMLAAMGPRMLDLCGARADGTILWLSGPRTVEEWIRPRLAEAAERAQRPSPRIVASVPVCVTDDAARVRGSISTVLAGYSDLPSYRRMMDMEGAAGPADVSLVGDAAAVRRGIEAFAEAGTTDFSALEFTTTPDEVEATRSLLREML